MTDRELLEQAAKAAGIPKHDYDPITDKWYVGVPGAAWRPLTDDGDALRLAVAVGLRIEIDTIFYRTHCVVLRGSNWCTAPHNDDPNAATRRAIVRAAAEIGGTL